jgi:cyclomaltodextrinase
MTVPYWVQDAVFYQIFPDRFANGDISNDPPNVHPWNAAPTARGFQGGDLRGIIQKFDYLLDLGINAIYLNPIFQAASTHRYDTCDYFRIDPKLGDLDDFHALVQVAHRNDVRIILDGVFNHVGRGFFAFSDILENNEQSPYKDWFHIKKYPVDAYSPGDARDYLGWWNHKSMPKLNTAHPAVRKYLLKTARYWIEQGADGWRLDVPNEIDDDGFWSEFRQVVQAANREAYLLGEIWNMDPRWVNASHFDGLMNYPVREALLGFISGKLSPVQFAERVASLFKAYPRENTYAMYSLLGSHDTERLITLFEGDAQKVKLAFAFNFAYPGAPAVYYGDEIGIPGGKDPSCRHTFPWEETQWNHELHSWVQQLVSLRKRLPVLRRGDFEPFMVDDSRGCYAFIRRLGDKKLVAAFNASPLRRNLHLKVSGSIWRDGRIVHDLLGRGEYIISDNSFDLMLEPWSSVYIS